MEVRGFPPTGVMGPSPALDGGAGVLHKYFFK